MVICLLNNGSDATCNVNVMHRRQVPPDSDGALNLE